MNSDSKLTVIRTALKRNWSKDAVIAKNYHVPTLQIFLDRIWCKIAHGVAMQEEYDYFGVYRLNHLERRNLYTTGRFFETCKWFFTPEMEKAVDEKKGFCVNFEEFLNRAYILLPCKQENLLQFAEKHRVLFVKKNVACGGHGVYKYSAEEIKSNQQLLKDISTMDGVAEELIVQHPKMAELNPSAVSTLRIVTLIEKNGNINIMSAALRIGGEHATVDNVSSGGHIFEVSLETGIVVGYGKSFLGEKTLKAATGMIVPGFQIPCWNEVLTLIQKAAAKFPEARFVGWDVAIGENGPLLVEANMSTGAKVMQFGDYGCWNYIRSQR